MSTRNRPRFGGRVARTAALGTVLGTVLLFSSGLAGSVQAAQGVCRSDPVVVLSNLKTLDLSAVIYDSQSDLKSVTYTLHLPSGVKPLVVVPTDGLLGQIEHFGYVNDQRTGSYAVTTFASTGTTVPVTTTAVTVPLGLAVGHGSSNQNITVQL